MQGFSFNVHELSPPWKIARFISVENEEHATEKEWVLEVHLTNMKK
jgi:hypothetical protein